MRFLLRKGIYYLVSRGWGDLGRRTSGGGVERRRSDPKRSREYTSEDY